jgi:glycosyltransferase involved in cell wall biosynthesis
LIGPWIPTGIDGEVFKPANSKLKPEDFGFPKDFTIVLLVARMDHSKGVDLAICAIYMLRNRGRKVGLLIRGNGPEKDKLEALSKELSVEDRVSLLGPQSKTDMAKLYNSSDDFLLARREDLFPFCLLEAGGCGVPSVSTQVGCVEDFIQDGVTGLLVPPNSAKALADGIERLLLDDNLRQNIGKNACMHFSKNFDMRIVAKH